MEKPDIEIFDTSELIDELTSRSKFGIIILQSYKSDRLVSSMKTQDVPDSEGDFYTKSDVTELFEWAIRNKT